MMQAKLIRMVFLVMFFGLTSCREALKPEIIISNMENITAQNIAEKLIKQVKHYPIENYYYIYASQKGCYYEILVNDVPVFDYYKDGQSISPIEINSYINRSGPQTITYKLYPQLTKDGADGYKELLDWTEIKIEVFERNNAEKGEHAFDSERKVTAHHSAYKPDGKTFIAEGKDYYEYTFKFNAVVPYENAGWENSQDLRKMDKEKLLERTINAYKQIWSIFKAKNADAYFQMIYKQKIESCQAEYFSEKEIRDGIKDQMTPFLESTYELQPLNDYRMSLYGNGRMVCLELTSMDPRIRGGWAIWGKYKDEDGDISAGFSRFYLHLPKGAKNFEVIR